MEICRLGSPGSSYGLVVGFCEDGNEPSGSKKKTGNLFSGYMTISFSGRSLSKQTVA